MTDNGTRTLTGEHGSRIITALEQAWSAIRELHPEIPAVVVITGSGAAQAGTPRGFQRRGHHWPERWVTGDQDGQRAPELFIAGELLDGDHAGRQVVEVMLHEAAHALAAGREIKDCSAAGNRYHNKRFAALAAEMGLRPPGRPAPVTGFSSCVITEETVTAYAEVIAGLDAARLPYLRGQALHTGGGEGGDGSGGEGDGGGGGTGEGGKKKRDGRRVAVECGCEPPRRIQLTPKAIEDGPILCGVCREPFEPPTAGEDDGGAEETGQAQAA
jgi:hypothetical protein